VVTAPLFVSTVTETTTSHVNAKAKSVQPLEITSPAPSPTDGTSPVLTYPTPTFTDPAPMSFASPSAALTPLPGKREGSSHSQTPGGSSTNVFQYLYFLRMTSILHENFDEHLNVYTGTETSASGAPLSKRLMKLSQEVRVAKLLSLNRFLMRFSQRDLTSEYLQ
jgi:hypothetical protein